MCFEKKNIEKTYNKGSGIKRTVNFNGDCLGNARLLRAIVLEANIEFVK